MNLYFPLIFLILIWCDSRNFLNFDREKYNQYFYAPRWLSLAWAILTALFICSSDKAENGLVVMLAVFILPTYLIRRGKLIRAIPDDSISPEYNNKFFLKADALGVLLHWLFWTTIMAGIVEALWFFEDDMNFEMYRLIFTALISFAVLMALIAKASRRLGGRDFWERVGLRNNDQEEWKIYAVPYLLGLFLALIGSVVLTARQVQPATPLNEVIDTTNSPIAMMGFIGLAVLLAPLFEEIIFRGYFYPVIERIWGRWAGIFIIVTVFALMHVYQYWTDWAAISLVAVLGFVLTYLRASTGLTISSVVMHYVYNVGVTFLPIIIGIFIHQTPIETKAPEVQETLIETQELKTARQEDGIFLRGRKDLMNFIK